MRTVVGAPGSENPFGFVSACISDDGRFVAFTSAATNLTPHGAAGSFVRDRRLGTTALVTVSSAGVAGNAGGTSVSMSADGRLVVYNSNSTNLVPNDTNGVPDVFVHDLRRHTTERVSVSSTGAQANATNGFAGISADGRFVAFNSMATNLAPGVTTSTGRVYVHDRLNRVTRLATRTVDGNPPNGSSGLPVLSGDGRVLSTQSLASNLVPNDTNGFSDVFVQKAFVPSGHPTRY